jgi:hypothetical protein
VDDKATEATEATEAGDATRGAAKDAAGDAGEGDDAAAPAKKKPKRYASCRVEIARPLQHVSLRTNSTHRLIMRLLATHPCRFASCVG